MEPSFRHKDFIAGNVKIFFPFEPYPTQREYATAVVEALTKNQNAILESPTGTGKTLSLLCATLAWLQAQGGKAKPIVYYTSRTHIQLAQAAKELKRTAYAKIPSIVIGSRAQMCLNHEVRQQGGDHLLNRACRNAIAKNACQYHTNYEQKLEKIDSDLCLDIEDLMSHGARNQMCPYYASKKLAESKSTVVFMPYNYLLDPTLRKGDQLRLENSIIIFDEAHNIEGVLKDAVSGQFTQLCLKNVQESCLKLPEKVTEALNFESRGLTRYGYDPSKKANKESSEGSKSKKNKNPNEPEKVNPIEDLASKLTMEKLQQVSRCAESLLKHVPTYFAVDVENKGKTVTVETLLDVLKMAGIHYATSDHIIQTLDSMSSFYSIAGVMNPVQVAKSVASISNLCNFITLIFPDRAVTQKRLTEHENKLKQYYISYMEGTFETSRLFNNGRGVMKDWQLNLWCLFPAIGMNRVMHDNCIRGPRSIIITSGTLAPLHMVENELKTKFAIQKSFAHIIGQDQLKILAFDQSPTGYSLSSTYEASKTDNYKLALGKTLLPLIRVLPFGTLIFFASYGAMEKAIKFWKDKSTIWRDMESASKLFVESKTQDNFTNDVILFKRKINEKRKAVFFCVCRGKLSEGVNLEGNHCRTVILTGLPYPSIGDPRIKESRKFNETKRHDANWYTRQMTRALNQTIGRVIRSSTDFGMLILCEPRFTKYKMALSEWTWPFFPTFATKFDQVEKELKEFFSKHDIDIRESVSESHGAFEMGFSSTPLSTQSSQVKAIPSQISSISGPQPNQPQTQLQLTQSTQWPQSNQWQIHTQPSQQAQVPQLPAKQAQQRPVREQISQQPVQHQQQQQQQLPPAQNILGKVADFIAPYAAERKRAREEELRNKGSQNSDEPVIVEVRANLDDIFGNHSATPATLIQQELACNNGPEAQSNSNGSSKNLAPKSANIFKKKPKPPAATANNGTSNTNNPTNSVRVANGITNGHNEANGLTNNANPSTNIRPILPTNRAQNLPPTCQNVSEEYSILLQNKQNKNLPPIHKCYICKNPARSPVRLNCSCARIACQRCSAPLNNRDCGQCRTKLKKGLFKPLINCKNKA